MSVSDVVMVESELYSKIGLTHCLYICNLVTGWVPIFIDYKSYTMVPGSAAPQDFLKVFLECKFRVESDTKKFHFRIDFEPLAIQFQDGF